MPPLPVIRGFFNTHRLRNLGKSKASGNTRERLAASRGKGMKWTSGRPSGFPVYFRLLLAFPFALRSWYITWRVDRFTWFTKTFPWQETKIYDSYGFLFVMSRSAQLGSHQCIIPLQTSSYLPRSSRSQLGLTVVNYWERDVTCPQKIHEKTYSIHTLHLAVNLFRISVAHRKNSYWQARREAKGVWTHRVAVPFLN